MKEEGGGRGIRVLWRLGPLTPCVSGPVTPRHGCLSQERIPFL
jgi:hypothetical protein